ncbi:hypothetical protein F4780DRAFT_446349 [Xylariomycetidae sp. FL0641]|nr:hypothetical protein F4780DRAFT_446349 [Xylariomycetidae sp. FL0641]
MWCSRCSGRALRFTPHHHPRCSSSQLVHRRCHMVVLLLMTNTASPHNSCFEQGSKTDMRGNGPCLARRRESVVGPRCAIGVTRTQGDCRFTLSRNRDRLETDHDFLTTDSWDPYWSFQSDAVGRNIQLQKFEGPLSITLRRSMALFSCRSPLP